MDDFLKIIIAGLFSFLTALYLLNKKWHLESKSTDKLIEQRKSLISLKPAYKNTKREAVLKVRISVIDNKILGFNPAALVANRLLVIAIITQSVLLISILVRKSPNLYQFFSEHLALSEFIGILIGLSIMLFYFCIGWFLFEVLPIRILEKLDIKEHGEILPTSYTASTAEKTKRIFKAFLYTVKRTRTFINKIKCLLTSKFTFNK